MDQIWKLKEVLRFAAVSSWTGIAVLSLVPGRDRPHTGASGNVEHVMAYVLAAAVTRLAFPHVQSRWQIIAFSAASAVFEICQIWIPGRSAGIDNWLASSSGAVVGVVLVRAVLHERLRRWL